MEDEFNRLIKECEELIPDPIPDEYVSRKPIHKYIGLWSAGDCPLSSQYKIITEYNKAYSQWKKEARDTRKQEQAKISEDEEFNEKRGQLINKVLKRTNRAVLAERGRPKGARSIVID